jgi:hypothetical protein
MPNTFFYSDLLGDHTHRLTKHFKVDRPVVIKLKTKPSYDVDLAHEFRLEKIVENRSREESSESVQALRYEVHNGTKLHYNWRDFSERFKFTNTDFKLSLGYQPADFNNADRSLELSHSTNFEPATGKLTHHEGLDFGTHKLGPLGLWTTLAFHWNNADADRLFKNSLNL